MAEHLIELTRISDAEPTVPVLVNLDNVAWIEPMSDGASRITFAVALPYERANGMPLQLVVRESVAEIALLAGASRLSDRDAIAQAWAEQTGRRSIDDRRQE